MPTRTATTSTTSRAARRSPVKHASPAAEPTPPSLRDIADALFRVSCEACRQHRRYACLVEHEALPVELRSGGEMVRLADELLATMADTYERAACELPHAKADDDWWHAANVLWLAGREWLRHRDIGDDMPRERRDHSPACFEGMAVEYELQASALLGLHQATRAYHRVRPDAELEGRRQTTTH